MVTKETEIIDDKEEDEDEKAKNILFESYLSHLTSTYINNYSGVTDSRRTAKTDFTAMHIAAYELSHPDAEDYSISTTAKETLSGIRQRINMHKECLKNLNQPK